MPSVFVSSTSKDLVEYRRAVVAAIEAREGFRCESMEKWGARPEKTEIVCYEKVSSCDYFVGIVGLCFGSSVPGDSRSYTQFEYESALAADKPCLMFRCREEFSVPGNLREAEELWNRQQEFRNSIRSLYETFLSAEELVAKVIQGIENCDLRKFDLQDRTQLINPEVSLAPKVCDRSLQVEAFRQFALTNALNKPGIPQLCFIQGKLSDAHDSFVDRLIGQVIRPLSSDSPSNPVQVCWQEHTANIGFVIRSLFREMSVSYDSHSDCSASAFIKLAERFCNAPLNISNDIHERNWKSETLRAVTDYYNFWNEVAEQRMLSRGSLDQMGSITVFINIIYRDASDQEDEINRLHIKNALEALARLPRRRSARCSTIVLDTFSNVEQDHVMDWFKQVRLSHVDLETRINECRKIFGHPPKGVPMARVETHLRRLATL
jgi:hypothetical protein